MISRDSPERCEVSSESQPNRRENEIADQSSQLNPHHPIRDHEFRSQVTPSITGFPVPTDNISLTTIAAEVDLYFELFHRQPIWCFDRQELEQNAELPSEVVYSILELTARFSQRQESICYGESARWSIMLRVANGTVQLESIESLCLLSYSAFIGTISPATPFHVY